MEFKAINTQEEFDAAIKARLERNTKSVTEEVTKKFEGWLSKEEHDRQLSELNKQITGLTEQSEKDKRSIAELTEKNKAFETSAAKHKAAREAGLPFELAERLSGNTPDELKADAEALSKLMGSGNVGYTAPLFEAQGGTANGSADPKNEAYYSLIDGLLEK